MTSQVKKNDNRSFLLLGTNTGDRYDWLAKAIRMISEKGCSVICGSSIYETEPWGFVSHDYFLNLALEITTGLLPGELLKTIHAIESDLGRTWSAIKYQSRNIDIDILFYNDLVIHTADLVIPHPLIPERKFVLVPLNEIAPGFIHPVLHKTVSELLKDCTDHSAIKKISSFH